VERCKNFSIQHFRKWILVDRDPIGYPFVFGDVLIQIALTLDRARHIETAKANKNAPESNRFL